ncbi:MAG: ABC transporter transmembrane domain-containing protein [Parvibaculaceae bacterium]
MTAEASTGRRGAAADFEDSGARRPKSRNLKPLARLFPFVLRYRWRLAAALLSLLAAAGASLAVPLAVRRIIDHGFSAENAAFVNQYFAMMLAVVAVLAAGSGLRYYFVTWIGERVVTDLRTRVFAHVLALDPGFYDTQRTGEVISRLTADTTQIKAAFGASASTALRNLVTLLGAAVMMVVTSPKLSGLVLLAIPLIVLPLVVSGRRVRGLSRAAQDRLAESAALAQESLSSVTTIQAFGQEMRLRRQFDDASEAAFTAARRRTASRGWLTAAIIFIASGAVVAVLWYGAQEVLADRLTGGALGQFVLYAAFAAASLGALSEVWGDIQLAAGASERLAELLDTSPVIAAPATPRALPSPPRGTIAFQDVHFSYPARRGEKALHGASFEVRQGERLAIVGPSGAGKSTIFNLLLRFYDPHAGRILIDGVDIATADPQAVRSRIALVPQETIIFSASILDNIRFGRPEASDAEVRRAAEAAQVEEFIPQLEHGYDTLAGERGVALSGGQRQRIAIARAILRDAPILLLDEATSALDAESERLVQAALEQLMQGRTSLVIAHRLATVRKSDTILVLDRGRVSARGTHDELIAEQGLYANLARLQFTG